MPTKQSDILTTRASQNHGWAKNFNIITTVSKSIDFLPLAGNYLLEVGNYPLLLYIPEAM
jgi:hypothetical protein